MSWKSGLFRETNPKRLWLMLTLLLGIQAGGSTAAGLTAAALRAAADAIEGGSLPALTDQDVGWYMEFTPGWSHPRLVYMESGQREWQSMPSLRYAAGFDPAEWRAVVRYGENTKGYEIHVYNLRTKQGRWQSLPVLEEID